MACFRTKTPHLGKCWRDLQWKLLVYFMAIWSIVRPFGIFVATWYIFLVICYIFPRFGMLSHEKSGSHVLPHGCPSDPTCVNFFSQNFHNFETVPKICDFDEKSVRNYRYTHQKTPQI
jgi:hypothetical protein